MIIRLSRKSLKVKKNTPAAMKDKTNQIFPIFVAIQVSLVIDQPTEETLLYEA